MAAASVNDNHVEMAESHGQQLQENDVKMEPKVEGSAVSESGSTESKTESEGLLTIDETAQAQEQEGKLIISIN